VSYNSTTKNDELNTQKALVQPIARAAIGAQGVAPARFSPIRKLRGLRVLFARRLNLRVRLSAHRVKEVLRNSHLVGATVHLNGWWLFTFMYLRGS
jgi:hypothetical protein